MAPIYEYQCTNKDCQEITDVVRSISERNEPAECGKCGAQAIKITSLSDFKIKGTPPRNWRPLSKSNPKSHVPNVKEMIHKRKKENNEI